MVWPSAPTLPHVGGSAPDSLLRETSMAAGRRRPDQLSGSAPVRTFPERLRNLRGLLAVQLSWDKLPCRLLLASDSCDSLQCVPQEAIRQQGRCHTAG